jgi:hypothetical protein
MYGPLPQFGSKEIDMFANRIRRFTLQPPQLEKPQPAFALMNGAGIGIAAGVLYRTAYLRAFATVQQRVIRRRKLHAARRVSWN